MRVSQQNDLALFEPNLVPEEPGDNELVDDDEVAPPQEATKKRTDGILMVGRLGFPMEDVKPSPATEACVYCGKVDHTRQCQETGCARRFHHFCVIDAKGEEDDHKFCDLH